MSSAFEYLMTAQAIEEKDYPYTSGSTATTGTCAYDSKPHVSVSVATYNYVTGNDGD